MPIWARPMLLLARGKRPRPRSSEPCPWTATEICTTSFTFFTRDKASRDWRNGHSPSPKDCAPENCKTIGAGSNDQRNQEAEGRRQRAVSRRQWVVSRPSRPTRENEANQGAVTRIIQGLKQEYPVVWQRLDNIKLMHWSA